MSTLPSPRFPFTLVSAAVLSLLGAWSPGALAQSTPAPDAEPVTLPTVVINASADASAEGLKPAYAGRQVARGGRVGLLGSQDMMDTPFSITNYTQELMQNQQAASVGDVLQNDPAVRVARGFGNYQQLYMVRGLPVYSDDMAYNGLYGLLPRQYLAAEILERVEVLRGASAFLNGAAPGGSGIGGAINVMPKRAPNQPLAEITLGAETGGQGYAAADFGRRFGPDRSLGLRVNAVRRDGETSVDNAKRELSLLSIGADYRGSGVRVSADIGYQDHKLKAAQPSITIGAGLAIPTPPEASRNLAQPWTHSNERDTFGTLRAEWDLGAQTTAWAAGGMRQGDESAVFANPTVTAADGSTSTYRFDNTRKDAIRTAELGVRTRLETGAVKHSLSASASSYRAKSKNAYAFSDFSGFAGKLYSPSEVAAPSADFFTGGVLSAPLLTEETKTSSLAVADVLSFAQDTVLLTLGARQQKIESYSYDYNSGAQTAGYAESRVTPVAGAVFKATKELSLYATYIEGLVKGDTAPANSANPGEVFAPYQSKQTEVGLKLDTGRLGGTLSAFSTRKPAASLNATTNRFEVTSQQRYRGAELSVFGEALPGLKLLGGVSLLHTDLDGKDGIGAPKSQANVGVEWAVPGVEGLSLNGRVTQTASQFADKDNTQTVPAWTRLDIGARYLLAIGEHPLTLRARLDNVADRNYWASAGGYPGAGYLTLGAPRTLVVSATYEF